MRDDGDNQDVKTEIRNRVICSMASGFNGQRLKIKSDLINYRLCQKKNNKCIETG